MPKEVTVALAQIASKVGDKEHNIKLMETKVKEAKKQGANLVVFPELALTGYVCRDLVYELAEPVPKGPSIRRITSLAKQENVHIVFGMIEQSTKANAARRRIDRFIIHASC